MALAYAWAVSSSWVARAPTGEALDPTLGADALARAAVLGLLWRQSRPLRLARAPRAYAVMALAVVGLLGLNIWTADRVHLTEVENAVYVFRDGRLTPVGGWLRAAQLAIVALSLPLSLWTTRRIGRGSVYEEARAGRR